MAKQTINIGSAANDGTGSTLRESFDITNDNFTELYGGTGGLFHKIEGTNFTGSLLIGHTTTGTLSSAEYNTGIGISALDALTSGDRNVAVGALAGTNINSATGNVLVGSNSGDALTGGSYNIAIGYHALSAEDGHGKNIAIGYRALQDQNAGVDAYNIAIGHDTGKEITTGKENVIIGAVAGDALTTGVRNVAIGHAALSAEDEHGGNVAIGYESLLVQDADDNAYNTAVGYRAGKSISTGVKNTLIGGLAGDDLTTGSNNIIIGYEAAASAVGVSNEVTIGDSNITNVRIPSDSTLKIGASGDLQLEHVSSNSFIKNTDTGDLYIENQVDNASIIFRCDDGSGGLDTYFSVVGAGNRVQYNKNLRLIDNAVASFGSDDDLQIYHDGTDSHVRNTQSSGDLIIRNSVNDHDIIFQSDDGSNGDATYFFLDGSLASGGSLFTRFPDNSNLGFGNSNDLRIYHNGTNSNIENFGGTLQIIQNVNDGDIKFLSDDGSGGTTEYFRLDGENENVIFSKPVGIGTGSPAALLGITGTGDALRIESTNTGSGGAQIDLLHFTTSPADNDAHGIINFGGYYTGTTSVYGSQIRSVWSDVSDRDSELQFFTNNAGTLTKALTLDTGQNATFAGTVTAGSYFLGDDASISLATTGAGTVFLRPNGQSTSGQMKVESSGNATFAGAITVTGKVTANTGSGYDSIKIASNFTADTNKQAGITTENYQGNSVSIFQTFTSSSGNTVYYGSADGAHSGLQNHRFYVNADGNTPGSGHTQALHIASNTNATFGGTITTTGTLTVNTGHVNVDSGYSFQWGDTHERIEQSDGKIEFFANNTQQMTLSGANLGIGTDSPGALLHLANTSGGPIYLEDTDATDTFDITSISNGGGNFSLDTRRTSDGGFVSTDYQIVKNTSGADYHRWLTQGSERMRINASGDVLVGTTGAISTGNGLSINSTGQMRIGRASTGSIKQIIFSNPNDEVGSISTSGSATAFNTSSDYRLKEDLKDFDGLDKISKIPVYDFKWKVDDSRSYGVMAHELQEVVPNAVNGEKDAEEMQGVDYSKIVPLLIKSIQELEARVKTLENK